VSGAERSGMRTAGTEVTAASFPNESRVVPAPAGSPALAEANTDNLANRDGSRHPTVDDLIAEVRAKLDHYATLRERAATTREMTDRILALAANLPRAEFPSKMPDLEQYRIWQGA